MSVVYLPIIFKYTAFVITFLFILFSGDFTIVLKICWYKLYDKYFGSRNYKLNSFNFYHLKLYTWCSTTCSRYATSYRWLNFADSLLLFNGTKQIFFFLPVYLTILHHQYSPPIIVWPLIISYKSYKIIRFKLFIKKGCIAAYIISTHGNCFIKFIEYAIRTKTTHPWRKFTEYAIFDYYKTNYTVK